MSKSGDLQKKKVLPKLKRFFQPNFGDLKKKKKKGLDQIEAVFVSKSGDLQKKRFSPKLKRFFQPNFGDLKKKKKGLDQNSVTSPDQLWVRS